VNGSKQIAAFVGAVLASALATHFGSAALQAPSVTGVECATMLMQVAAACTGEGCP
jgi:hypothetical protein